MARAVRMVLVTVAIASTACASRGAVRQLRSDVDRLAGSITAIRTEQSVAPAREEAQKAEIRTLATHITTIDARVADTREQLARVDGRLAAAEQVLRDLGAKLDAIQASVAKLEAAGPPPPPTVAAVTPPLRESTGASRPTASPDDAYASALAMFRAREHGQAVLDFIDFLARHPAHPLAPNAQYWIGEAYFVQQDYRQAIIEFQKVLGYGIRNAKAPDALLRAGMAWNRLRDIPRARALWQRVVREYPASTAAQKARQLLAGAPPSSVTR